MTVMFLEAVDTTYLDRRLLSDRRLIDRVPSAKELGAVPHMHLIQWCVRNARYTIPTVELVEWLRTLIGGRSAVEICAGHGELGRAIGVPMTDSYVQVDNAKLRAYYAAIQQTTTRPPPDVEKLDGLAAVAKLRPQVVVGSWVTQLYCDGDRPGESSVYGVDEVAMWRDLGVETYVHIGSVRAHGTKRLRKERHDVYSLPFLFGRGFDPKDNVIFVWSR